MVDAAGAELAFIEHDGSMDRLYNGVRPHSSSGGLTPEEVYTVIAGRDRGGEIGGLN